MSERRRMDRPASTTAAAMGIVLLAVSLPYAIQEFGAGTAGNYDIAWAAVSLGYDQRGQQPAAGQTANVPLPVVDKITGTVSVVMSPAECNDTFNAQFQQSPVTITWALTRNQQAIPGGSGSFTCATIPTNGVLFPYPAHPAPDIGLAAGTTPTEAEKDAYAQARSAGLNETAGYNVTWSWSRPADGPLGGLPVAPGKSFTATMKVQATVWKATAIEPDPAVPR